MEHAESDDIVRHLVILAARQDAMNAQLVAIADRLERGAEREGRTLDRLERTLDRLDATLASTAQALLRFLRQGDNGHGA